MLSRTPTWLIEAITQGLVYLAVHHQIGSATQFYLTLHQLTPPLAIDKPPVDTADERPKTWKQRYLPTRGQAAFIATYAGILALIWVLPKYGNRWLLDAIWIVIEMVMLSAVFHGAINALFPLPRTLRLEWPTAKAMKAKKPPTTFVYKSDPLQPAGTSRPFWNHPRFRGVLAIIIAAAVVFASYIGVPARVLVSAAWVLFFGGSFSIYRLKMWVVATAITVYFAGIPLLTGGLIWIISRFVSSDNGENTSKSTDATPSPWLTDLMMSFQSVAGILPTLVLLGMTHRWLLCQSLVPSAKSAPGGSLEVPRGNAPAIPPSPERRIYRLCAVFFYLGIQALFVGMSWRAGEDKEKQAIVPVAILFGTPLLLTAAIAGVTAAHGRFREWLNYYEEYVPRLPDTDEERDKKEAADVEKALLLED